jgi:hypothetical protein
MGDVRAKVRCVAKKETASAYGKPGKIDGEIVEFSPVSGPGNEGWSKWTPSGSISLHITNPEALKRFEVGKDYFVDFTPAGPVE